MVASVGFTAQLNNKKKPALPTPPKSPALAGSGQPNPALQTATNASVARINKPVSIQQSGIAGNTNQALSGAINQDLTRPNNGTDAITQAQLMRFNTEAEEARKRQLQELSQAGIIRDGSRVDVLGKFDSGTLQGRADIRSRGYQRGLDERRASMGQGLQLSQLSDSQSLERQALENSLRQGDINQGFTGAAIAANQARQAGELDLALRGLDQNQAQFNANIGQQNLNRDFDTARFQDTLTEQGRQYDGSQDFANRQLGTQDRQFEQDLIERTRAREAGDTLQRDIESGRMGLANRTLDDSIRQFDEGRIDARADRTLVRDSIFNQNRQFDSGLEEQQRQYDANLQQNSFDRALQRDLQSASLGESGRQFNQGQLFQGLQNQQDRTLQGEIERNRLAFNREGLTETGRQFDEGRIDARADRTLVRDSIFNQNEQFNTAQANAIAEANLDRNQQNSQFNRGQDLIREQLTGNIASANPGAAPIRSLQATQFDNDLALRQQLADLQGTQVENQNAQFNRSQDLAREELSGIIQGANPSGPPILSLAAQQLAQQNNQFDSDLAVRQQLANAQDTQNTNQNAQFNRAQDFAREQATGQISSANPSGSPALSLAAQQLALQRDELTGVIGGQDTLAARQLAQQNAQFNRGQDLTREQLTGNIQSQDPNGAPTRSLAASQFDRSFDRQGDQFDRQLSQQNAQFNRGQDLTREQLTGQIQGSNPNAAPIQSLAARQLGVAEEQLSQQDRQFLAQLDQQNSQFNRGQDFAREQATGQIRSANPNGRPIESLAAQQVGLQRDQLSLSRDQLDQQNAQFNRSQDLSREQMTGQIQGANPNGPPIQSLAAQQLADARRFNEAGLTGQYDGNDTLAAQQLDQQNSQFNRSQDLSREQMTGQIQGANPNGPPIQSLAAQQLANQASQFQDDLGYRNDVRNDTNRQFNQSQDLTREQLIGMIQGNNPNAAPQQSLAAQQLSQQDQQFIASQLQQNNQFNRGQDLTREQLTGQIRNGANGPPTQSLAAQQLTQQGDQFNRGLTEQTDARTQQDRQFMDQLTQQGDQFDRSFNSNEDQRALENRQLRLALGLEATQGLGGFEGQVRQEQITRGIFNEAGLGGALPDDFDRDTDINADGTLRTAEQDLEEQRLSREASNALANAFAVNNGAPPPDRSASKRAASSGGHEQYRAAPGSGLTSAQISQFLALGELTNIGGTIVNRSRQVVGYV